MEESRRAGTYTAGSDVGRDGRVHLGKRARSGHGDESVSELHLDG